VTAIGFKYLPVPWNPSSGGRTDSRHGRERGPVPVTPQCRAPPSAWQPPLRFTDETDRIICLYCRFSQAAEGTLMRKLTESPRTHCSHAEADRAGAQNAASWAVPVHEYRRQVFLVVTSTGPKCWLPQSPQAIRGDGCQSK